MTTFKRNSVEIVGYFTDDEPIFSHESFGEKFYTRRIKVFRKSGNIDILPVLLSEYIKLNEDENTKYKINGTIRSYNLHTDDKNRVLLNILVNSVEEVSNTRKDENVVELTGYICKQPTFRKTPFGRCISDLTIAVNRAYGKSDYLPCIAWGDTARAANGFSVGDKITLRGRFQSREYLKDNQVRVAYEISIMDLDKVEGDE